MDSGVSASQKYAPEIHSVMMTGALREKFPNLASHRQARKVRRSVDKPISIRATALAACRRTNGSENGRYGREWEMPIVSSITNLRLGRDIAVAMLTYQYRSARCAWIVSILNARLRCSDEARIPKSQQ